VQNGLVRQPFATIVCECGHVRNIPLAEVLTCPTIECTACGCVAHITEAMIAAVIRRFGDEVLDLSRWKPRKVRRDTGRVPRGA
jgi:hypothetical protein